MKQQVIVKLKSKIPCEYKIMLLNRIRGDQPPASPTYSTTTLSYLLHFYLNHQLPKLLSRIMSQQAEDTSCLVHSSPLIFFDLPLPLLNLLQPTSNTQLLVHPHTASYMPKPSQSHFHHLVHQGDHSHLVLYNILTLVSKSILTQSMNSLFSP